MLTIYHSPMSRSTRVIWFCEEIGLEYQLRTLEMFSDEMTSAEYLRVNPLGKVPAIDDNGFVVWETGAILHYLNAKYASQTLLPPPATEAGARALQWLEFGENPLTVIMGEIAAHSGPMPAERQIPALVARGEEMAPNLVAIIEDALGDQQWIVGDEFSAADIALIFGLMIADYLGFVTDSSPRVRAYLARGMARPAFQRAAAQ